MPPSIMYRIESRKDESKKSLNNNNNNNKESIWEYYELFTHRFGANKSSYVNITFFFRIFLSLHPVCYGVHSFICYSLINFKSFYTYICFTWRKKLSYVSKENTFGKWAIWIIGFFSLFLAAHVHTLHNYCILYLFDQNGFFFRNCFGFPIISVFRVWYECDLLSSVFGYSVWFPTSLVFFKEFFLLYVRFSTFGCTSSQKSISSILNQFGVLDCDFVMSDSKYSVLNEWAPLYLNILFLYGYALRNRVPSAYFSSLEGICRQFHIFWSQTELY